MIREDDRLGAIWCDVLGVASVNDRDDFIQVGGTSVQAVDLAAQIQEEFGVIVDAIDVIENTEFGALAALVSSRIDS